MSDILGTYDLKKKLEDCVILLENTRKSYGDSDYAIETESGLLNMVQVKLQLQAKARYALVTFSNKANVELSFENFSFEAFKEALYDIELSKSPVSNLRLGLELAFQTLVKAMQQLIEGKRFRMIIISDGQFEGSSTKWEELLEKIGKVGIIIDTIEVNYGLGSSEALENIAKRTGGWYQICQAKDFETNLAELAVDKVEVGDEKLRTEEDRGMSALLEEIASELLSLNDGIETVADLRKLIVQEDENFKCGICHSPDCMITKSPAYADGSFCPACNRFFHLNCCAAWAESLKDTPSNVLKCPMCQQLLKVPGELHRMKVLKEELKLRLDVEGTGAEIKELNVSEIGRDGLTKVCAYCHNIFEPDGDALVCSKCGAFYHKEDCFQATLKKYIDRCKVCDSKLDMRFSTRPGIERII